MKPQSTRWRRSSIAAALLLLGSMPVIQACGKAAGTDGEILPGRSRPLLEHTWPHPRDLAFAENGFQAPDGQSSLVTTSSGVRAFVVPADERLVQLTAVLPLGRAVENQGEAGGAELLSNLLAQQIRGRLGPEFAGRVQIDQDPDLTRVALHALSDDWRRALDALIGSIRELPIDRNTVEAYRTGSGYARPTRGLAGAAFRPSVELARQQGGYPLAPPESGRSIRYEAVSGLLARTVRPATIVLGIGGGVVRAEAERALEDLTAGWLVHDGPTAPPWPAIQPAGSERLHAIEEPGFTTWIALGHAVPALAADDEAAVAVMTEIVNIRLNIAVREMRGLANQAVLQMPATIRHGGLLHVRTGGRPESVAPLIHYSRQELQRIREAAGAPSEDELAQVKGGLVLGQWQRALDGPRAASATYAVETARRGSLDRLMRWPRAIAAVTKEQVIEVARKYIQPDRIAAVVIGQIAAVRAARHPRWPIALDDALQSPSGRTHP